MTVCHVYWLFDAMVAHIRMTNPFGGGDDEESKDETLRLDGPVKSTVTESESGFSLAKAVSNSGLQRGATGITTFKTIDAVRDKDPLLADFLSEFTED